MNERVEPPSGADEGGEDAVTMNPLDDAADNAYGGGDKGLTKVKVGMRALGVDERYNIEKLDLRGVKKAPWISDTCKACFYKPGPDPDGNQPAILVLFPQFVGVSVFFTYICFALPVDDACDTASTRGMGEWPSDHWLFYITGWLQCVLMFLPIPLFGVFLARIGMPMAADSNREAQVMACGEDWPTFLLGLKITAGTSFVSIALAVGLARFWTGFPVPFTHLSAGFPGFFAVFVATAYYLFNDGEDNPRLPTKMVQLVTMQACVFFNISCFSVLSALIKSSNDPASPVYGYALLFTLLFTVVKSTSKFIVTWALKSDFDNALPLLAFLNINAAVFPKVALPSSVSIPVYFAAAFVDVAMTFWGLKILWLPVIRLTKAQKAIDKEQSEADEAGMQVKKLKDRLKEAKENIKEEEAAAFDQLEAKLQEAEAKRQKEDQDVDEARAFKDREKSVHDLGGLAAEVSFQWKNPDFLLKNPDLLSGILIFD